LPPALQAVLPLCALVFLGWTATVTRVLDRQVGVSFGLYAIRIGIPVLIFHAVMVSDFATISPWMLWACYFPPAALSWTLGHVLILKVLHRDERTSVIAGVGSAFANTAFVGLPLARAVYGEHGVIIVTILISIHMPLMMPEQGRRGRLAAGVGIGAGVENQHFDGAWVVSTFESAPKPMS
jgi:predicted permease